MDLKIQTISICQGKRDVEWEDSGNENIDVIILLNNGEKFVASFFAYNNIEKLREAHSTTGDYLNGKYFWMPNMILIDQCEKENIITVVQHLIDEGDFRMVFKKISS